MAYRNYEWYPDPTAYLAIRNVNKQRNQPQSILAVSVGESVDINGLMHKGDEGNDKRRISKPDTAGNKYC